MPSPWGQTGPTDLLHHPPSKGTEALGGENICLHTDPKQQTGDRESERQRVSRTERRELIGRPTRPSGGPGGLRDAQGAELSSGQANWKAWRGRGLAARLPGLGGRQDGGCGRGSSLFSSPAHPPSPSLPPPSLQERAFAPPPPCSESPPLLRFPLVQSLVPVGPAAPAPALSGRAAAPITSAAGPAPPFGAPGRGRAGRRAGWRGPGSGARSPPAPASVASAVPLPGPRWGPCPAAAAAPGGGGGMEPPLLPLPPRSPAEGREGSAPRQDPPLRPPPATSTPSLAPSLTLRALPQNGSESTKEGETGKKNPPTRARRGGGRGGAERRAEAPLPPRGTVPGSASRWRCGRGEGAEQRPGLRPPRCRRTVALPATGRARREGWGRSGLVGRDRGP
ncbi:collagen alpha-1(I) chain-like [Aotus nancymaae]|uniref:collagen alpha-1(I) chain-like n=1 Tax=Aotus nancymaae TaxID=37293 RepID=UPI0030FE69A9